MLEESDRHREARDEAFVVLSDLSEVADCCLSASRKCPSSLEVPASHLTSLEKFSGQVSDIREILARRHYKVVFLGRTSRYYSERWPQCCNVLTSSGKSTLINALLGEMEKISGKVRVDGSIAYAGKEITEINK